MDERNILRDRQVLDAAARVIRTKGLAAFSREAIAAEAGVSPASVSNFGRARISRGTHDRIGYRTRILGALMTDAIARGDKDMVRVGLADGCLRAADVPGELLG